MKGAKLITVILLPLAVILCTVMAIISPEESASQNHWKEFDFLLNAFLLSIIIPCAMLYNSAKEKDMHLAKVASKNMSLNQAIGYMLAFFCGILIFGVNHSYKWVEILHLIFTGSGILMGNFIILFYAKSIRDRRISYFQVAFSLTGFALGFIFKMYSTTWAEVFAAIPIGYTFYLINKKQ